MKPPCPVPLHDPWSPVGYQVVEVAEFADECLPAPPGPLPARRSEGNRSRSAARWMPSSPLGYQVRAVAEETVAPEPPKPPPPAVLPYEPPPRPRVHPLAVWGPCVLGGVVIVGLVFLAALTAGPRPLPEVAIPAAEAPKAPVVVANAPVAPGDIEAGDVIIPQAAEADAGAKADAPARPVVPLPAGAEDACPPGERQRFGTTVEFARNPQEAARLAAGQRKLTFLLHVSGNFEEARFT
jgi:hypothetical protein